MKIYKVFIFLIITIILLTSLSTVKVPMVKAEKETYYIHSITYLSFKTEDGYPLATILFNTMYKIDFNGSYEEVFVVKSYEILYSNIECIGGEMPIYGRFKNNTVIEEGWVDLHIPYILNITEIFTEIFTEFPQLGGEHGIGIIIGITCKPTLYLGQVKTYASNDSIMEGATTEPALYIDWQIQNFSVGYVDGYVENISYPVSLAVVHASPQDLRENGNLTFYNYQDIFVSHTPDVFQTQLNTAIIRLNYYFKDTYDKYISLNNQYNSLQDNYSQTLEKYNNLKTQHSSALDKYAQLNNQFNQLASEYTNLKALYSSTKVKYVQLENQHKQLADKYNALKNQYNQMAGNYGNLKNQYIELQQKYEILEYTLISVIILAGVIIGIIMKRHKT